MKFGVVMFPGSNCDHDAFYALSVNAGKDTTYLWHKDTVIPSGIDCIILPGGFSYGDYLRCGAIARFSPIMNEVIRFANSGGYVMGICNGFQVLTEAGLLPGTLLRNSSLSFVCKDIFLNVRNNNTAFTSLMQVGDVLRIPVAHGEGNYFADTETINILESENRVLFKYCAADGAINEESNPNGSVNNIAGIINEKRNVLGMMPHPERYSDKMMGCSDGIAIFNSLSKQFEII
ncbi:MAG: Phosphoribosylformylglycinamidine synthase subunit PurQ [Ignavibacteria bacterium]|nr:Phosphoribosylformylglycinamidine synthase subunit PurQ [Ignavibacteria bacterium]